MSRKRRGHADKTKGLRLKRKLGERVRLMIGDTIIWVDISRIEAECVTLAFSAPLTVAISREECLPCPE